MKRTSITSALLPALLASVAFAQGGNPSAPSMRQRGQTIFTALAAKPVDAAALRGALQDIGHVEASYRSEPLKKWVDGARIIDSRLYLTRTVGLNRLAGGAAPPEWVEKLTSGLEGGLRLLVLKLAYAAPAQARARRDRLLADADEKLRAGLSELAEKYPQLNKTNWGTLEEALEGKSPAGCVSIWAAHFHGGKSGTKAPVTKDDRYNVFVLLRPLHWPVPGGEWSMQPVHSHLALMGQVFADAGDPELRAALKKLVADAVAPLERLNDAVTKGDVAAIPPVEPAPAPKPAPTPAPRPALKPAASAKSMARAKLLQASLASFSLILQYNGPQDKPYYSLSLLVEQVEHRGEEFWPIVQVSAQQAGKIVDALAAEGFLDRARNITNSRILLPRGPCYALTVLVAPKDEPARLTLYEELGWGTEMLKRLDGLRKALDGDAAKAMDVLLARLSGQRAAGP